MEKKILIYGLGNPDRQDDALGIEFINDIDSFIKENQLPDLETDQSYQLNIEDAEKIAGFDKVFFVDASKERIESFRISQVKPLINSNFSTHSFSSSHIFYLCQVIFKKEPLIQLIEIKGYNWELGKEMSSKAKKNLETSLEYFKKEYLIKKEGDF